MRAGTADAVGPEKEGENACTVVQSSPGTSPSAAGHHRYCFRLKWTGLPNVHEDSVLSCRDAPLYLVPNTQRQDGIINTGFMFGVSTGAQEQKRGKGPGLKRGERQRGGQIGRHGISRHQTG